MRTTRDLLDWPAEGHRPWWTRAVDARIDPKCERRDYLKCMEGRWRRDGAITVLLAHSGIGPCELADKLRDAPAPYTVVYDDTQIDTYSRGEPELVRVRAPRRVERRRRGLAAPGVAAPREPRADDLCGNQSVCRVHPVALH